MRKYLTYKRRPLVIYDFATNPFWISLYSRKIFFSFLSVLYIHGTPLGTPLSNKSMHLEVGQGCLLYQLWLPSIDIFDNKLKVNIYVLKVGCTTILTTWWLRADREAKFNSKTLHYYTFFSHSLLVWMKNCYNKKTFYTHILPLPNLCDFFKLQFMQRFIQGFLPCSFNNTWISNVARRPETVSMVLRNHDDFYVSITRLKTLESFPLYSFPKLWENFPDENIKFIRNWIQ